MKRNAGLGVGTRTLFKKPNDEHWIEINGITSVGALGGSYSTVDQTTLADTVKRVSKGIYDPPEIELKGDRYMDDDTQNQLIAAAKNGDDVVIRHIWTDGEALEYDALLTSYEISESSNEEKRMFTIKGKANSKLREIEVEASV